MQDLVTKFCHGLCRRAYPNVQNLFGELGIDDRLQVRQGFVALHGRGVYALCCLH